MAGGWRFELPQLAARGSAAATCRLQLKASCPRTPQLLSHTLALRAGALQVPIWNLWLDGTPYSMDYGSGSNAYAILKVGSFVWFSGLGSLRLVSAHGLRIRGSFIIS